MIFYQLKEAIGKIFLAIFLLFSANFVAAQSAGTYPNKPIVLVVTYPPGGGADAMARLVAPRMADVLKQSVVVENRPGASGQIGAASVARANPDGYTIMLDASSFAVNPSLFKKLPYDSLKAFKPIGVIALFPNVVLVNSGFPAQSVKDLISASKKHTNAVAYASSGNGSAQHLAGALFETAAKVELLHIPYKGGGPALADVMAGHVPLFFGNLASSLPHIQSGKLRALAVTSAKRSPILPNVPTLAEAGIRDAEIYEWNAIFVPAGTPDAIVSKLSEALQMALEHNDVKARIAQLGGDMRHNSPNQAQSFIQEQVNLWARVIKERNITTD
jgi:tripartite-type tricarboxylate transporter receptor subunit TctC